MANPGSPTSAIKDPEDEKGKPSYGYWLGQLEAYDRAARRSLKEAQEAWDEFTAGGRRVDAVSDIVKDDDARYPLYWSTSRVLRPALYSRTPIPVAEKAIDSLDDNVARLASICAERRAKYCIRSCEFDEVMRVTVDNFIHTGKATFRICFDSEIEEQDEKEAPAEEMPPPTAPQPELPPEAIGQPNGDMGMGATDPNSTGGDYGNMLPSAPSAPSEPKVKVKIELLPVHFKDIRHTPNARYDSEITWFSYDSWMTKQDVEERWDAEKAKRFNYTPLKESKKDTNQSSEERGIPELGVTITEIWNKRKKQVYWLCKDYDGDEGQKEFIEVKDDPYKLMGFVPSPRFMLGTHGPNNMFTVPDYTQLKPLFSQVHAMAARFRTTMRAARVVGLVDGSVPELKDMETLGDSEFITLAKFQEIFANKKLEDLIEFFPTKELSEAAANLWQAVKEVEQAVYSLWGIPDILRGITDPNVTVEAQQQAGKFISGMFSSVQREFQRLVRDGIEMMVDMCSTLFPASKRLEIDGVQFMTPEDQQLWPQVDQLLQNDEERSIRIEIETDSTHTLNQNAEIEQANYLAKTLTDGFGAVATASAQNPLYGVAALKALLLVIAKVRTGKEIEEEIRPMVKMLEQQAQQPQPDPEAQKAQQQAQLEQVKSQAKMQIEQAKAQAQMQAENTRAQADIAIKNSETQGKAALQQQQAQHKAELAQIQALADQKNTQSQAALMQLKTELQGKLELHKTVLDAALSKAEAQRELKQTALEASIAFSQKAAETKASGDKGPPNITVHVEPNKPKRRKVKITHDAEGNATVDSQEIPIGE